MELRWRALPAGSAKIANAEGKQWRPYATRAVLETFLKHRCLTSLIVISGRGYLSDLIRVWQVSNLRKVPHAYQ